MSNLVIGEKSTTRYSTLGKHKQDSIPVECVPPTCKLHVFWWPALGVSTRGGVCTQMNKFEQVSSDDHHKESGTHGGGVCTQMNKFEQVPSDDHQMSMAEDKGI